MKEIDYSKYKCYNNSENSPYQQSMMNGIVPSSIIDMGDDLKIMSEHWIKSFSLKNLKEYEVSGGKKGDLYCCKIQIGLNFVETTDESFIKCMQVALIDMDKIMAKHGK